MNIVKYTNTQIILCIITAVLSIRNHDKKKIYNVIYKFSRAAIGQINGFLTHVNEF